MSNIINVLLETANYATKDMLVDQMENACKEYKLIPSDKTFAAVTCIGTLISMKQAIDGMGIDKVRAKVKESESASRLFNFNDN